MIRKPAGFCPQAGTRGVNVAGFTQKAHWPGVRLFGLRCSRSRPRTFVSADQCVAPTYAACLLAREAVVLTSVLPRDALLCSLARPANLFGVYTRRGRPQRLVQASRARACGRTCACKGMNCAVRSRACVQATRLLLWSSTQPAADLAGAAGGQAVRVRDSRRGVAPMRVCERVAWRSSLPRMRAGYPQVTGAASGKLRQAQQPSCS